MKFLKEIKEIFIVLVFVFLFRSTILNWYSIPSGSMLPTLKIGDHVVVNKLSYGVMPPFLETRIFSWDEPKKGDIVVFQGPASEGAQVLIKRVLGTAGDRVSFENGVLTVNGVVARENLETDRSILIDLGTNDDLSNYFLISESGFSTNPHLILRKKVVELLLLIQKLGLYQKEKFFV